MDKFKIITIDGVEKEVDGIFYLYNSKYFFAYTEKEVDEKGYIIFNLVQVGKEIKNTPAGPVDTGYMIGMEIQDTEEWKLVQESITKIVEDKRNDAHSDEIQYLPKDMLSTLKINGTKTFRLAKNVVEQVFNLNLSTEIQILEENQPLSLTEVQELPFKTVSEFENQITPEAQGLTYENNNSQQQINADLIEQNDVIIDYRARFFEEQEKNKQLEEQIRLLTEKLENIKLLID